MRTLEYKNPLPHPPKGRKMKPSWLYVWLSHWLHAYSIPRHGCHYFLGRIPSPQITPYLLKFQHRTNNVSACDLPPLFTTLRLKGCKASFPTTYLINISHFHCNNKTKK
jgi:hypothetical protein